MNLISVRDGQSAYYAMVIKDLIIDHDVEKRKGGARAAQRDDVGLTTDAIS